MPGQHRAAGPSRAQPNAKHRHKRPKNSHRRSGVNGAASAVSRSLANFALRALAEVETNVDALLPLLAEHLQNPETTTGAAYAFSRLGVAGIPPLLHGLKSANSPTSLACEAALELMVQDADSPRRFVNRNKAFEALVATANARRQDTNAEPLASILQAYASNAPPTSRALATSIFNDPAFPKPGQAPPGSSR